MKIIFNKLKFLSLPLFLGFLPLLTSAAQGLVPCGPGTSKTSCDLCDLFTLVQNVINFSIGIAMVLGTAFIVYGGFLILTAGGSPERVKSGRSAIIAAIVGLIIVLGSWLIVDTVIKVISGGAFGPWNKLTC